MVKLAHQDHIRIGSYTLQVKLSDQDSSHNDEFAAPFSSHHLWESSPLLDVMAHDTTTYTEPHQEMPINDPLLGLALDGEKAQPNLLDDSESTNVELNKSSNPAAISVSESRSVSKPRSVSRSLKQMFGLMPKRHMNQKIETSKHHHTVNHEGQLTIQHQTTKEGAMNEYTLDLLEEEIAIQPLTERVSHGGVNQEHLVAAPIMDGLGVKMDNANDVEQMHHFSQEIGASLQATIRGILALHNQVGSGRFGTLNRNLQPIEDNPLRLGLSYEETLKTLYAKNKSAVHLSAPSAIEESLLNIQRHNEAMQQATGEALSQVLEAFSPQVLLRRFQHYRRSHELEDQDEAWAWKMYCHYYQELISERQQGFEKLFWEIFEQAYDRKIRDRSVEL